MNARNVSAILPEKLRLSCLVAGVAMVCVSTPTAAESASIKAEKPAVGPMVKTTAAPTALSQVFVPVSIKLSFVRAALEAGLPYEETGQKANIVGSPVSGDVLSWHLTRSNLDYFVVDDKRLMTSAAITGLLRFTGRVRLAGGKLGRFLGKLGARHISIRQNARLEGYVTATAQPQLISNWRVVPDLRLFLDITRAKIPIRHVGNISVRRPVRKALRARLARLQGRLNRKVTSGRFLEKAARKHWQKLCGVYRLSKSPALWLKVTPQRIQASQPLLGDKRLTITVGILAATEVIAAADKPQVNCPPLPQRLKLAALPESGKFTLHVPARLSYARLGTEMSNLLAGRTFDVANKAAKLEIKSVSVEPSGDKLLLTAGVRGFTSGLFGASAAGKIYLTARPVFDEKSQTLCLQDIKVDVASKSALAVFSGTISSLAGGFIESKLAKVAKLEIAPLLAFQKLRAQKAVDALTKKLGKDVAPEIRITDIVLEKVSVTEGALLLHARSTGNIALKLKAIPFRF